ncbi:hypothetical protein PoB_001506400 [Plakobranchus ocellatus]|uniref:Uncharacterized protein n=1 Tax=Plakobranchus ocellatus TaxID=259542 RepID=A0AAV3YZT1_9GAST|nr:hypothetical protein PoB_001506400 [Plakobranchus ocellatus]
MRDGTFVYHNSKKPLPALKWLMNNPDNWRGIEDCVHTFWGSLNDINCGFIAKYLCEGCESLDLCLLMPGSIHDPMMSLILSPGSVSNHFATNNCVLMCCTEPESSIKLK